MKTEFKERGKQTTRTNPDKPVSMDLSEEIPHLDDVFTEIATAVSSVTVVDKLPKKMDCGCPMHCTICGGTENGKSGCRMGCNCGCRYDKFGAPQ